MRYETKVSSEGFIRQDQFALQGKNSDSGHFSLCWGDVRCSPRQNFPNELKLSILWVQWNLQYKVCGKSEFLMDIPLTFALSHSKLVSSLYRAQVLCFYTFGINGKHPRDDESRHRSMWNESPPTSRVCNLNSFWGFLTCFRFYPWKTRKDGQERRR